MARVRRYFEAKGEILKTLTAMFKERHRTMKALMDFARQHGGINVATYDGMGFSWIIVCEKGKNPTNPELWRQDKHKIGWQPRQSTKAGKAIAAQMRRLGEAVPSAAKFGKAIKLGMFCEGLYVMTPGIEMHGDRLFVTVGTDNYKPPKGMELVRISDVEYERLTAERKKKRAKRKKAAA